MKTIVIFLIIVLALLLFIMSILLFVLSFFKRFVRLRKYGFMTLLLFFVCSSFSIYKIYSDILVPSAKRITDKIPDINKPYKEANIDSFYWERNGWDYVSVPLVKPFVLLKLDGYDEWEISTGFNKHNEIGISNILYFNISNMHVYGYKPFEKDEKDSNFHSLEKWFIINIEENRLIFFNKEEDYKTELKKLKLPDEYFTPDEVLNLYLSEGVLPWFPQSVKNQIQTIRTSKDQKEYIIEYNPCDSHYEIQELACKTIAFVSKLLNFLLPETRSECKSCSTIVLEEKPQENN